MRGDPALRAAAVALLAGWQDAFGFLSLQGDDWLIANAVVAEAQRIQIERRDSEIRALGAHIANQVARLLAQAFRH